MHGSTQCYYVERTGALRHAAWHDPVGSGCLGRSIQVCTCYCFCACALRGARFRTAGPVLIKWRPNLINLDFTGLGNALLITAEGTFNVRTQLAISTWRLGYLRLSALARAACSWSACVQSTSCHLFDRRRRTKTERVDVHIGSSTNRCPFQLANSHVLRGRASCRGPAARGKKCSFSDR